MNKPQRVSLIGVPLDLGQSERGTDVGPTALRYAGLREKLNQEGHDVFDQGDISVPKAHQVKAADNIVAIADAMQELYLHCCRAYKDERIPITLGGDHSVAIGSVSATVEQGRAGVLWVDAHGDFNTPETSPSGNVHGMPLAVLLGHGDERLMNVGERTRRLRGEDVVLIGIRSLDPLERSALNEAGVRVFSMRDIDERGMNQVAHEALGALSHCELLHVSLDVDALDPVAAPGVATPVRGGLSYREAQLLMELVADTQKLMALDIVEVNPMLDVRNQTAETAVALALSALGQSII